MWIMSDLRTSGGPGGPRIISQPRLDVVYFDQQTGALHTVGWSKSIFLTLKQLFLSLTEQNKEKRKESRTKTCKNMQY